MIAMWRGPGNGFLARRPDRAVGLAAALLLAACGPPPVTPGPPPGTVTGLVCYPSESIPPMTLYFQEINTNLFTSLPHPDGSNTYQVELTPGTYVAFAWLDPPVLGGSYSQAVPCGLTVSCTDHSLIQFQVLPQQTTADVDICDWYDQASVPAPPAAATPTPGLAELQVFAPQNVNCRRRDTTDSEVTGTLFEGQSVPLLGVNPDRTWGVITHPNTDLGTCWIWLGVVEIQGDLARADVRLPPVEPTATSCPPSLAGRPGCP